MSQGSMWTNRDGEGEEVQLIWQIVSVQSVSVRTIAILVSTKFKSLWADRDGEGEGVQLIWLIESVQSVSVCTIYSLVCTKFKNDSFKKICVFNLEQHYPIANVVQPSGRGCGSSERAQLKPISFGWESARMKME